MERVFMAGERSRGPSDILYTEDFEGIKRFVVVLEFLFFFLGGAGGAKIILINLFVML